RRDGAASAQVVADLVVVFPDCHRRGLATAVAGARAALGIELTIHPQRNFLRRQLRPSVEFAHYHLRSLSVPSSGRSSAAIASRARKIRERTVPIGQFITLAISS